MQYAGNVEVLRSHLEASGWTVETASGWSGLLRSLDGDAGPDTLPVLGASNSGHPDALVMTRRGERVGTRLVLHLWPSALVLSSGQPVWQGAVAEVRFDRSLRMISLWRVTDRFDAALQQLQQATVPLQQRATGRGGDAVLLLRAVPRG